MHDNVAEQSITVNSFEYELARQIARANITSTEIGAKLSLKIESGIAVIAPMNIGEIPLIKEDAKSIAKMAKARYNPSPKTIIAPYAEQKYKNIAEQRSFVSSLYLSPLTSQNFAPDVIINEERIMHVEIISLRGNSCAEEKAQ